MPKLIGNITWEPQPEYPKLSGEQGDESITMQFVADMNNIAGFLPDYNSTFYDDRYPFFNLFDKLTLSSREVETMIGGLTCLIKLEYTVPELDDYNTEHNVMEEVEYDGNGGDEPIETHPDYRTNWNYAVIVKEGTTEPADKNSWWADNTNQALDETLAKTYRWIKPSEQVPDGWYLAYDATIPGIEAFLYGHPKVIVRRKSRNEDDLVKEADKDLTLQNPPKTFGRSGVWLQNVSRMKKEGRYWVQTVEYLNAAVWNPKIYH